MLEESDVAYKLIGPALIRQETGEAKTSVNKRIGYISGEIKRVDGVVDKLKTDVRQKEELLNGLMQQYQNMMV